MSTLLHAYVLNAVGDVIEVTLDGNLATQVTANATGCFGAPTQMRVDPKHVVLATTADEARPLLRQLSPTRS